MKTLTISYENGLSRSRSLREHVATRVYSGAGVTAIAGKLDMAPSKLSEKLAGCDSGGKLRGLSVDDFERYLAETKDFTPIHYLIQKYLECPDVQHAEALAKLQQLSAQFGALAEQLGGKWP